MAPIENIEINSRVLIRKIDSNGDYQEMIGTLVHIDPYADGDYYGVHFLSGTSTVYFYREDFDVVDDVNIGSRVQIIEDWRIATRKGTVEFALLKGMYGKVITFDVDMHPGAALVEIEPMEGVIWLENRFWCFFQDLRIV